ncbi:MAG: hypothetical protein ACOCRX_03425 [Candidatus Woesearchaeota archaeon]
MKKFERFIVYPLLIVALFYSFSGEQVTTATENVIDRLVVREISVINDEGVENINIGSNNLMGGRIKIEDTMFNEQHRGFTNITSQSVSINSITEERSNSVSLNSLGLKVQDDDYETNISPANVSLSESINIFVNPDAPKIISFGIGDNDNGAIKINNSSGDSLVKIGEDNGKNDNGVIKINNSRGDSLIKMGADDDAHGLIKIFDKYGEVFKDYSFR